MCNQISSFKVANLVMISVNTNFIIFVKHIEIYIFIFIIWVYCNIYSSLYQKVNFNIKV